MSANIDPADFRDYVTTKFPSADLDSHPIDFGEVYLRFDLGGEHPNESDDRIQQATDRAVSLFRYCTRDSDNLVLLIKDWEMTGRERWRSNPAHYLSSVIRDFDAKTATVATANLADGERACRRFLFPTVLGNMDCVKLFQAIAHREQGRTPRVSQAVYIVNRSNNTVFYMYDDRGCVVYASEPYSLRQLHLQHGAWLVDSERTHFDTLFA